MILRRTLPYNSSAAQLAKKTMTVAIQCMHMHHELAYAIVCLCPSGRTWAPTSAVMLLSGIPQQPCVDLFRVPVVWVTAECRAGPILKHQHSMRVGLVRLPGEGQQCGKEALVDLHAATPSGDCRCRHLRRTLKPSMLLVGTPYASSPLVLLGYNAPFWRPAASTMTGYQDQNLIIPCLPTREGN